LEHTKNVKKKSPRRTQNETSNALMRSQKGKPYVQQKKKASKQGKKKEVEGCDGSGKKRCRNYGTRHREERGANEKKKKKIDRPESGDSSERGAVYTRKGKKKWP